MNNIVDGPVLDKEGLKIILRKLVDKIQHRKNTPKYSNGANNLIEFNYPVYKDFSNNISIESNTINLGDKLIKKYKELIFKYISNGNSIVLSSSTDNWKCNYTINNNHIFLPEGYYLININFNTKIIIIKKYI